MLLPQVPIYLDFFLKQIQHGRAGFIPARSSSHKKKTLKWHLSDIK
jgi:hypothetical protein